MRSPTDSRRSVAAKAALRLGGAMVWTVDCRDRTVTVHRAGEAPETFDESATLRAGRVVSGLVLPVADVFGD